MTTVEQAYADRLRGHEEMYGKLTSKEEAIAMLFYAMGFKDGE